MDTEYLNLATLGEAYSELVDIWDVSYPLPTFTSLTLRWDIAQLRLLKPQIVALSECH